MTEHLPVIDIRAQLLARTFQREAMPLPFARDIFLLETHIAGIQYHQAKTIRAELQPGLMLKLLREPNNVHDRLAIGILTLDNIKLGYVPRLRNAVLARLMDAGKLLVAEVTRVIEPEAAGDEDESLYWDEEFRPCHDENEVRFRISLREQ